MRSSDDFPAPLRPRIVKPSPDCDGKTDAGENVAAAAPAGQIEGGKPHQQCPAQSAIAKPASYGAWEPAIPGMLTTNSCRSGTSLEKTL